MKTIWKYNLVVVGSNELWVPRGAKVLDIQMQAGSLNLWALVNPEAVQERLLVTVYGTGWKLPEDPGKYMATVQEANGFLVWHVFDVTDLK